MKIDKTVVWEAFGRVKANKGAAGVDGQTIEEFERDAKANLFKIWNRMSSGSYFPPPVKAVEIPQAGGKGVRVLGVPTVADRIAQTVVRMYLEPTVLPLRVAPLPASAQHAPCAMGRTQIQTAQAPRTKSHGMAGPDRPTISRLVRPLAPRRTS